MTGFCSACGAQRADGAGFCGQCGHRFETGVPEAAPRPAPGPAAASGQAPPPPLPSQGQPASAGTAPPAPASPKRPLSIGQKLMLGLFLIGFALVSVVLIEATSRARHPNHHYR